MQPDKPRDRRAARGLPGLAHKPAGWRRRTFTVSVVLIGATALAAQRGIGVAMLFVGACVATLLLMPITARVARRLGAVALPGGRAIHDVPTPLIGGAALYVPMAITLIVLGSMGDTKAWGLLVGGTLVFVCGLVDDTRGVSARVKILAQLAGAACLMVSGFSLQGMGVENWGYYEVTEAWVGAAALCLWVVFATNALNLADGMDGLATSLFLLGLGVVVAGGVESVLPSALAGASVGFLYYNFPKARIFLGDAGSLLLGFILAALVLEIPATKNVPLAYAALAYPIGDVGLAMSRRFIRGKPVFAPDRRHLHHLFINLLGSPVRALLGLLVLASTHAAICVIWPRSESLVLCAGLWVAVGAYFVRRSLTPAERVLGDRKQMRMMHQAQGYVDASLEHAQTGAEVELALRHLLEALKLDVVDVGGLRIESSRVTSGDYEGPNGAPDALRIRSIGGFCSWSAATTMPTESLEHEREIIVTTLLRRADERLLSIAQKNPAAPVG